MKEIESLLYLTILILGIYYSIITENRSIKYSIISFLLFPLSKVLKYIISNGILTGYLGLIGVFASVIILWIHTYNTKQINSRDKILIGLYSIPLITEFVGFFIIKTFTIITIILTPISIIILLYYTLKYKDSDYLTEELRIMNLYGIPLIFGMINIIKYIIK